MQGSDYSDITQIANPIIVMAYDIYLAADGKQLAIRYDPQVSNYSNVVSESLTQTLGSQYPFIQRNGNVNYRTFSLSGLITCFMDVDGNTMAASKIDIYKDAA
jgi:hypothetical protein